MFVVGCLLFVVCCLLLVVCWLFPKQRLRWRVLYNASRLVRGLRPPKSVARPLPPDQTCSNAIKAFVFLIQGSNNTVKLMVSATTVGGQRNFLVSNSQFPIPHSHPISQFQRSLEKPLFRVPCRQGVILIYIYIYIYIYHNYNRHNNDDNITPWRQGTLNNGFSGDRWNWEIGWEWGIGNWKLGNCVGPRPRLLKPLVLLCFWSLGSKNHWFL